MNDTMTQGGATALWLSGELEYSFTRAPHISGFGSYGLTRRKQSRRLQTMEDLLIRIAENLISRVSGPMKFRLILLISRPRTTVAQMVGEHLGELPAPLTNCFVCKSDSLHRWYLDEIRLMIFCIRCPIFQCTSPPSAAGDFRSYSWRDLMVLIILRGKH